MCSSFVIPMRVPESESGRQSKDLSLRKIECSSAKKGEGLVNRREYGSVLFDTFDSRYLESSPV